ncbi:hypothetical protein [Paenibacillus sp. FSL L8-0494]|uniref:hypothetical protein n=1 Tax=Paenibacillus sp. FSL L8-0494 TaxID=2975352 RepID=UPI0030F98A7B
MRSVQITKTNISSLPLDWIYIRYQRLQKSCLKSEGETHSDELDLIREYFDLNGYAAIFGITNKSDADQMEMEIPTASRSQYVPIIENRLREHYRLTQRKHNLEQQLTDILGAFYVLDLPKMTATYGNISGVQTRGGVSSPIEDAVMRPFSRAEKIKEELMNVEDRLYDMAHALSELTEPQLSLVSAKYLVRREPKDDQLMSVLGFGRQKYYEIKKTSLIRIAQELSVI